MVLAKLGTVTHSPAGDLYLYLSTYCSLLVLAKLRTVSHSPAGGRVISRVGSTQPASQPSQMTFGMFGGWGGDMHMYLP